MCEKMLNVISHTGGLIINQGNQIKTRIRWHLTLIRMMIKKKKDGL